MCIYLNVVLSPHQRSSAFHFIIFINMLIQPFTMNIFQAIILGIVQGITEWLPVSSSGHLVLFQQLFGFGADVAFDVLLHLATLIVILIVFWEDILAILKSLFAWKWDENTKLLLFIVLATIPTAIIGLLFQDWLLGLFTNMLLLGVFFIINGFMLLMTRFAKAKGELSWWKSLVIGIAQGISIIPSISRSGATISAGMFLGIKKENLVKFSFLMAVPAIIGAAILELDKLVMTDLVPMIAGTLAALVVGYFSLRWLIKLIEKSKFYAFGYYCIILGIIILAIIIF
jgi:undecaprenyl-diphosphatase